MSNPFRYFKTSPEIIRLAVMMYVRFPLSLRQAHQQRPLADACKRAKIKPAVRFHDLRHTHGSALAIKGVPMAVIAAQLGHADTRMTDCGIVRLNLTGLRRP